MRGTNMKRAIRASRAIALLLAISMVSGCDALLDDVYKTYKGPPPASEGLTGERMILRAFQHVVDGRPQHYYLDRLRFLDRGDSLHIDRIIIGMPGTLQARIDSLGLERGDTLVVSTEFRGTTFSGGLEAYIPNWGANRYHERYPVALHTLTSVARIGR